MKNIIHIDNVQAIVQSRFEKNSVHKTRPNVIASGPPSSSGITNSPIEAEKTRIAPVTIPDLDNGIVIFQKVFVGRHPRSYAASMYDLSTFSSTA